MNDFPDSLPPMMVKELRQGLRSRAFYYTFFLTIIGLFAVIIPKDPSFTATEDYFFTALGIALVVVFPLRGLVAFSSEESKTMLDIIRISNLGTWKIVIGKWSAIIAQAVLFTMTTLPFIIVRYFAGGTSLPLELLWVAVFLAANLFFTAFNVLVSTARATPVRMFGSLLAIVAAVFALDIIHPLYEASARNNATSYWMQYVGYFAGVALGLYALLLTISSILSSPSENFATATRITILIFLLAIFGVKLVDGLLHHHEARHQHELFLLSLGLTIFAFCAALAEPVSQTSSGLKRFGSSKLITRYMLEPGWHSGILFLILSCGISAATRLINFDFANHPHQLIDFGALYLSLLVFLAVPGALAFSSTRLFGGRAPAFLALLAVSLLLYIALSFITTSLHLDPYSAPVIIMGCLIPPYLLSLAPGIGLNEIANNDVSLSIFVITTSSIHLTLLVAFLRHSLKKPFSQSASLIAKAQQE